MGRVELEERKVRRADKSKNAEKLKAIIEPIFHDAPRRAAMSDAARKLAKPDAADRVAAVITQMIESDR